MSDIVTGVRQLLQDLISPDLKAIAARQEVAEKHLVSLIEAQGKLVEAQGKHLGRLVEMQGESLRNQMATQSDLLLRMVDGFRAEVRLELSNIRSEPRLEMRDHVAPLSERAAVLEERSR